MTDRIFRRAQQWLSAHICFCDGYLATFPIRRNKSCPVLPWVLDCLSQPRGQKWHPPRSSKSLLELVATVSHLQEGSHCVGNDIIQHPPSPNKLDLSTGELKRQIIVRIKEGEFIQWDHIRKRNKEIQRPHHHHKSTSASWHEVEI